MPAGGIGRRATAGSRALADVATDTIVLPQQWMARVSSPHEPNAR